MVSPLCDCCRESDGWSTHAQVQGRAANRLYSCVYCQLLADSTLLTSTRHLSQKQMKVIRGGDGQPADSVADPITAPDVQLIHLSGFTDAEIEMYRQQIFQNLRDGMKACLALMEQEGMELANPDLLVCPSQKNRR
jgi:hypothetical protein